MRLTGIFCNCVSTPQREKNTRLLYPRLTDFYMFPGFPNPSNLNAFLFLPCTGSTFLKPGILSNALPETASCSVWFERILTVKF